MLSQRSSVKIVLGGKAEKIIGGNNVIRGCAA
jgi:hypothetical protein